MKHPIRVIVDSHTRVDGDAFDSEERIELLKNFEHDNTEYFKRKRMGFKTWPLKPVIKTWLDNDGELVLPRGGFVTLRSLAERWGRKLQVRDERTEGEYPREELPELRITPRAHQEDIIKAMIERQSGIVRAATGSGKTYATIAAAQRIGLPTLIIVWESGLFDQWVTNLDKALGIRGGEVGIVRGGEKRLRMVTIAMQQTLAKLPRDHEIFSAFGTVFFDEVQRAAANTCRLAVDPFRAKYRIGISADERRKDKMEGLIHELFGRVIYESNQAQLEGDGVVLPVDINVIPTNFEAPWYTPSKGENAYGTQDDDFNRLLDEMAHDEDRNEQIVDIVRRVPERTPFFVMVRRRDHGLILDQLITATGVRSGIMFGGADYAKVYDRTRADLESGRLNIAIGTIQSIGQGIDVPRVHDVILAAPAAGNRQLFNQARGRGCRPHGGAMSGRVWYLWDRHLFPGHLKNLDAWYPGRVFVLSDASGTRKTSASAYLKQMKRRARGGGDNYGGLFA